MPRFGLDPINTGTDDSDLVDVPFGTGQAATASSVWGTSPMVGALRADQVEAETEGREQSGSSLARFGRLPSLTVKRSTVLSAADAHLRIAEAGLKGRLQVPDAGIPERALQLLIEHKTQEVRNQEILDRYHPGVLGRAAQLGTSLAVSLADPINIGSAFIPVVREARYARLLEQAGTGFVRRASVRAGVGAVEGGVGAALVEPLVYSNQQQLQADYGVADSLLNIGFGSVFGGVLHPGAGAISDVFARRAGVGAWAETVRPDGTLDLPNLPEGAAGGGGVNFIHGDDILRGQYAVIEAHRLQSTAKAFDALDSDQVSGSSPYATAGAPVVRQDGTIVDGSRRVATLRRAYDDNSAVDYRAALLENAWRYGLDPSDLAGFAQPVLVRVEGARQVGAAKTLQATAEATKPRLTPTQAAAFVDRTVEELRSRSTTGLLDDASAAALRREDADLEALLRDHYAMKARDIVPANALRDGEVAFAEKRRLEIRAALGQSATATAFGHQLRQVLGKLDKLPDSDAALVDLAERMTRGALSPEQSTAAMRIAIAQATNGDQVDVGAVAMLDGTPAGVQRYLDARAAADAAVAAERNAIEAAALRAIESGKAFNPTDAAKLEADVKALEMEIREQLVASGDDLSSLDAVLAEADQVSEQLAIDEKAFRGIAMCMERSA